MAIADIEGPLVVGVHEDQSLIVFRAGSDDVREIVRATNGIARGGLCAVPKSPWVIYVEEDARTHPGNRSLNAVNVLNGVVAVPVMAMIGFFHASQKKFYFLFFEFFLYFHW